MLCLLLVRGYCFVTCAPGTSVSSWFPRSRWQEFYEFWKNVIGSGYAQDDILEEVEMMLEGGSWVDFDDGRTT